jgi:hypothetical protein
VRERLGNPAVRADIDEWDEVPPEYFQGLQQLEPRRLEAYPAVTDDRPSLEFDLIRLWRAGTPKPFRTIFW